MTKINKHYDNLNRPAGDLFPDLYVTDNVFSKDQNFSQGVESPTDNKNPAKGEDASFIDFSIHTGYGKNNGGLLQKTLTHSFVVICSIEYRTLDGVHHPGREGELENLVDRPFFKCAMAERAKAQTYRLVIVSSYGPS